MLSPQPINQKSDPQKNVESSPGCVKMADVSVHHWNMLMRFVTVQEQDPAKRMALISWMLDTQSLLAERAPTPAAISLPIPALPAIQQAATEHKHLPFLTGPHHPSISHETMVALMQEKSKTHKLPKFPCDKFEALMPALEGERIHHANLARGNVGNLQLEPDISNVLKSTATAIIGAFNHVPYRGTANNTTYLTVAVCCKHCNTQLRT